VIEKEPKLDAAQRARGRALEALGQLSDAATTHLARFDVGTGAAAAGVDDDVEALARVALAGGDLPTVTRLLERLAAEANDGPARGLAIIGDDERPSLLVLSAQLALAHGEPGAAVDSLRKLVRDNADARKQASEALERIVGSNQARPESDLALAEAYRAMDDGAAALSAVERLYTDNVADSERVRDAALEIVRSHDAGDARLFLARISLDMKDPRNATEHAIHARQLRPDSRKQVVGLLVSALDQDAFSAATHFALAEAHLAGDEAEDAVRHFRASVEVERSRAASSIQAMEESAPRSKHTSLLYLSIGSTHADFLRGHPDAITAFTSGLDAEPSAELRVSLLLARGDSHVAMGSVDKAFDDFDAASRLDRLERRYYEFLRVNHRKREAAKAEESALLAEEDFGAAADACGRFIRVGRLDEAVSVAQRALAVDHDNARARYLVGVALHAAERYGAAVQVLEAVRAKEGADSEIGRAARMLLAESYLDRGDRTDARACLTEIESVDADYPGLRARRAALAPPADDPQAPPPLFVRPEFPRPTE
jgi:tetratricopeptide (TPR) repeat protein